MSDADKHLDQLASNMRRLRDGNWRVVSSFQPDDPEIALFLLAEIDAASEAVARDSEEETEQPNNEFASRIRRDNTVGWGIMAHGHYAHGLTDAADEPPVEKFSCNEKALASLRYVALLDQAQIVVRCVDLMMGEDTYTEGCELFGQVRGAMVMDVIRVTVQRAGDDKERTLRMHEMNTKWARVPAFIAALATMREWRDAAVIMESGNKSRSDNKRAAPANTPDAPPR